ncbi:MAG TPA: YheC/YheD family protein [Clostridia bacterium]|nr:YheC/YheD family protein [Clostridia bacterium]
MRFINRFPITADRFRKKILDLCRKICVYLDTSGHHYAELGIDIAIDRDQNLWLIEANVFPSFKGFKKIDRETYLRIRYSPMIYARSLTGFENSGGEKHV